MARLLVERPEVDQVVGLDVAEVVTPGVATHRVDLAYTDVSEMIEGADAVIHLASVFGRNLDEAEIDGAVEVNMARRVLAAADKAGVSHMVMMSSATVYGPWANNPVPLTEKAALRPHPDLALAVQKAEVERLAAEFALDHPGATVARLRPVTVVDEGSRGWLAEALRAAASVPTADETPAQYLHLDDLASAVVAVWAAGLDGPVNVAPEGWLTPTERRELDPVPKVRLPEPVALAVANWRWRLGLAPTAPGILAYARHPWVVASDRLVGTGWHAESSNEEAYVAGHEARVIETITPQRRQELVLGVAGVAVAGVGAVIFALVRRRLRRRRSVTERS